MPVPDRTRPLVVKLLALAAGLLAAVVLWPGATVSTFDRTTATPGNSVAMGTATLTDNDAGSAVLALAAARSGDTTTGCITVSYTGVDAHVRLYGAVGGTGLSGNLALTVTRGTMSGTPAAKSCTNFVADATDYVGAGAGVMYSGTLAAFPQSLSSALLDPTPGAAATWASGTTRAYKLSVTMGSATGMQGKTATAGFTWQATSL